MEAGEHGSPHLASTSRVAEHGLEHGARHLAQLQQPGQPGAVRVAVGAREHVLARGPQKAGRRQRRALWLRFLWQVLTLPATNALQLQ